MSEKDLRALKKYFEDPRLTERQREALKRFDKDKVDAEDWNSIHTRLNYAKALSYLGWSCPKPFEKMMKEDITNFFTEKEYSKSTRVSFKAAFKQFFRWLYGLPVGQYPECVSWIKLKRVKSKLTKSDLVTEEETKRMIACAQNPRDPAIVSVLLESTFRPSEFLSMNVGDVEEKHYGFYVSCRDSKTVLRGVPLVWSSRYLGKWLNHHPYKDNPDAPLWISISNYSFGKRLVINSLTGLVKRIAIRAGVKKRVYPYLFRHSGATNLAVDDFHEAKMRRYCGWSPTSTMPARYIHLAGSDVENSILELRGVKVKPRKPMMEPKVCPRCEEENGPELTYCGKCGASLDKPTYAFDEISGQEAGKEKKKADYEALYEKIKKDIMRDLGLQPPK